MRKNGLTTYKHKIENVMFLTLNIYNVVVNREQKNSKSAKSKNWY